MLCFLRHQLCKFPVHDFHPRKIWSVLRLTEKFRCICLLSFSEICWISSSKRNSVAWSAFNISLMLILANLSSVWQDFLVEICSWLLKPFEIGVYLLQRIKKLMCALVALIFHVNFTEITFHSASGVCFEIKQAWWCLLWVRNTS